MAQKFAVFDIDGTLIRWQLYHSIVTELAHRGCLSPHAEQTINDARMTWKRRSHSKSFDEYEDTLVHTYLDAVRGLQVQDFLAAVDVVFEEYKDQVYTYTRDLIRRLKADGYLLFAVSGSQKEIIAKLADYYGFDDYRGSDFERQGDTFTGNFLSPFKGKAGPLRELMQKHGVTTTGSIGVGDTKSDISMLEIVEQPIAFNPSFELYEAAAANKWTIVVERKSMIYELEPKDGTYELVPLAKTGQ